MNNRLIYALLAGVAVVLVSCHNAKQEFPDYKYNATYFSYQYPIRTLIQGEDEQINTDQDNKGIFRIGVTMGGAYSNNKSRKVEYVIDETLTENLYSSTGVELAALPHSYYNFNESGTIVIPKGSMQGYMDIQLTDSFFEDVDSENFKYVIPVRIVTSETDSVLRGVPLFEGADRRIATEWYVKPLDFTIYAIKYINPWHGTYLYRGRDQYGVNNTVVYRNQYVERSEIKSLTTIAKNQTKLITQVRQSTGASPGDISMILTFDAENKCVVTSDASSYATVTGSGKFVKGGDSWGGKARHVIHLDYTYTDPATTEQHQVKDTLVIRDRNVKLETYSPVVK